MIETGRAATSAERLTAEAERLTAEIGMLRVALRRRAYVEQATGLLAGRLDCSLSQAFRHLASLALDTDTTVEEAAMLLLCEGPPLVLPRQSGPAGGFVPDSAEALLCPPARMTDQAAAPDQAPAPAADAADAARPDGAGSQADPPVPASVVDLLPVPALLLSPVSDSSGAIADFVIERNNDAESRVLADAATGPVTGKRLVQTFPGVVPAGLFGTLVHTYQTGQFLKLDLLSLRGILDGEYQDVTVDVRAQRVGDWLLVTWRGHDVASDRARRLEEARQLGGLGWGEWNLLTSTVTWSYEMYAMHGRDLADGPLPLADYLEAVHPDDAPVIEGMLRGLAERSEKTEAEYRVLAGADTRYLRVIATPVFDPANRLMLVRAVFQDVTPRRRAEQAVSAARDKIERERREATLRLQQAIMPTAGRRQFRFGRYDVCVRYQPAHSASRVGGDWYEARALPDGGAIIGVGDVAGHGLTAAAAMARISNALHGLSATGQPPGELLRWLNDIVCGDEDPELIASAAVGWLDPGRPALHWAQAGHPPPVVVSGGAARLLRRPPGLMLGSLPGERYVLATEELRQGDLLFWYTDGLIERRDRDIDDGLVILLGAADEVSAQTAAEALDELLDRLRATSSEDDICVLAVRVTD